MYVCVCKGVTEREVKEIVQQGCNNLHAVAKACGAGTDCGSCKFKLQKMIGESQADQETSVKAEGF